MGKVQSVFGNGFSGAVSRSIDDIIISVKNASEDDIPFGAPVFMTADGAVPFSTDAPQDYSAFLGFAVRVADKTPDEYPAGQFGRKPEGNWHKGDVMEVLVRGAMAVPLETAGTKGGAVYIRKEDGKLTASAGGAGTTVLLENVHLRNPRDTTTGCAEIVISERHIL